MTNRNGMSQTDEVTKRKIMRYRLEIYDCGALLIDTQHEDELIEVFPQNEGRFNNPAWESYLNKHWDEMKMNYQIKYM